jgi:hypothetical protein
MYDLKAVEKFLCARERILRILRDQIGQQTMGKGFEGAIRLVFPSCTDELTRDPSYDVVLDSTTLFSRHNVWSGSLSEIADNMNKDIDLYEKNLTRQPDNTNS